MSYLLDIDGNVYQTIKIGNQWWMAENLRTTRYRNGDEIPNKLSSTDWSNTTSGAYTIYPHSGGWRESDVEGINSDKEMLDAYGALYNWYAVADPRRLCPEGWRVPGDEDWKQLEMYLGMTQPEADKMDVRGIDEGGKLKSTRTQPIPHPRWDSPNVGATNEYGWSGLPGGGRRYQERYDGIGRIGSYWSYDEHTFFSTSAWYRELYLSGSKISRTFNSKRFGFSVRCFRD